MGAEQKNLKGPGVDHEPQFEDHDTQKNNNLHIDQWLRLSLLSYLHRRLRLKYLRQVSGRSKP